jgi:hypothetical protein
MALTGADIDTQKSLLCKFYGMNPDTAKLHTFKTDQFSPPFSWLSGCLGAEKIDLYVLSRPTDTTQKKFCIEVIAPKGLAGPRVKRAYSVLPTPAGTTGTNGQTVL